MDAAEPRSLEELMQVELPPDVWDGRDFTNIFCAIVFADIENSVQISRIVSPSEYDSLVDEFQTAMLRAVEEVRPSLDISTYEVAIAGDQLVIFFYDERAVKFNYLLDSEPRLMGEERHRVVREYAASNENLTLGALKAAIYLKNSWLIDNVNVERISQHRDPIGLALGVHADKVFLRNRADGRRRVEGYAVNVAKRVESYSRHGRFSKVMFSYQACNILRGTVRKHTQLRQRIFFHRHSVEADVLKGLGKAELFELKFMYRMQVPRPSDQVFTLYERILQHDNTNIWAYYQLSDHYRHSGQPVEKSMRLARRIYLACPNDEKIILDLATCYFIQGMLEMARDYCLHALELNSELDLAYELLARIYDIQKDHHAAVNNARHALLLSPGSPLNQMNMALALIEVGNATEAGYHAAHSLAGYADYLHEPAVVDCIRKVFEAQAANEGLIDVITRHRPELLEELQALAASNSEQEGGES